MKKLAYFSLIDIFPVNTGGKAVAYDFLSKYSKEYDVTLYYFEKSVFRERSIGYKDLPIKIVRFKKRSLLGMIPLLRKFHTEFLCGKELGSIKCDVIHVDFPYIYPIARKVANCNNAQLILGAHNIEWKYYKNSGNIFWPFLKFYENYVFRHVDVIRPISDADYKYLKSFRDLRGKLEYVHSDVNRTLFNPYGKRHAYGDKYFNILFYGNLASEQNVWALRYIKSELVPNLDDTFRMNVFGIGLKNSSLVDNAKITYIGPVNNPAEYIRGADVVIVPLANGAGTKIRVLESVACGKKVLVSRPVYSGLPSHIKKNVIVCTNTKYFIHHLLRLRKLDK